MKEEDLPECLVVDEEEAGFVDLDLRLIRLEVISNGGALAIGKGRHGNRTVGFAIELCPEWKASPIGDSDGFFFWGSGWVRSVGVESDTFVSILSALYGVPLEAESMRTETKVTIVALGDDPRLISEKPTHMKLFLEDEDPSRYAEVFVNVIATEQRLEFHEKDQEYRKPLLNALSLSGTRAG